MRVESLRCNCIAPKLLMKPSVTDKGKDVIIAAKNKRIRELEAEVDRLSSILKSFYAKEYEVFVGIRELLRVTIDKMHPADQWLIGMVDLLLVQIVAA